jgi:hypothetical protein
MSDQSTPADVIYKDLPGCPGYRVSSRGEVQSCFVRVGGLEGRWVHGESWRNLGTSKDKAGRPCVHLCLSGRRSTRRTCRLILLAFVGPCPPGYETCHRNGDPADNRAENLYWGTHADNMADRNRHGNYTRGSQHFGSKLTEDEVRLMRRLRRDGWSLGALARHFAIAKSTTAGIINGKFWRHV